MKKKINQKEIDLVDFFFIIKKNFIKIFSISLVSTILMIIYLLNQKPNQESYFTKTEIAPISTFDLSEYSAYNNYLKNVSNKYKARNKSEKITEDIMEMVNQINDFQHDLYYINKESLMELFIDQLKEREIFIEGIKKFDLINRDNFEFEKDFEDEVKKTANKINLINNKLNHWNLEFQVSDIKKWNSFLFFIEKKTNEEVRKYLNKNFENLISNEERLKKYRIEDLEIEISNSENDLNLKQKLLKVKKILIQDKKTVRLKDIFQATPIIDSNKFYAAKIIVHSTLYTNKSKNLSNTPLILSTAIISFVIGIFYVFISHSIRVRSN